MQKANPHTKLAPFRGINLTPIIDVVFIILIFGIVSYKTEGFRGYEVELPQEAHATEHSIKSDEQFIIAIKRTGQIFFQGKESSLTEIEETLTRHQNKSSKIFISADKEVPLETFIEILDIIHAAKMENSPILHTQKKKE